MKTCSRNKFLDCFRPSEVGDTDDQIVDCIAVSKKPSFRRSFSAVFKPNLVQSHQSKKDQDIHRSKSYCQLNTKFDDSSSNSQAGDHGSESPTSTLCFTPTPGSSFRSDDRCQTPNLGCCTEDGRDDIPESDLQEQTGMSRISRNEDSKLTR
ncbi:hypothetical protein vseg_018207 [Gypsophila vaccaria]